MRLLAASVTCICVVVVALPISGYLTARTASISTDGCLRSGPGSGGPIDADVDVVPVSNRGARLVVRVASWNTRSDNTTGRIIDGLRRIGSEADVIGVQELNNESRRDHVARELADSWVVSEGDNSVQILWRRNRYDLLAQGSQQVFGPTPVEDGVAGVTLGPKSIQWVQLRDQTTGAVFFAVNHHIVSTIDRGGRPDTSNPKRLGLYRQQMTAMIGLIGQLRAYGPVVATGDFNVDAKGDAENQDPTFPYELAGSAGLVSNWRALGYPGHGTHPGGRYLDYVWATAGTATFTSHRIGPSYGSDHASVTATVVNRATAGPAPSTDPAAAPPARAPRTARCRRR